MILFRDVILHLHQLIYINFRKIEPHCGTAMTRYLVQIHNMRISCPNKEIVIFDDDASGAFRHANLYPQATASHAHSVGQKLCIPVDPFFGSNVSPHN